jgi:hypothetical protein
LCVNPQQCNFGSLPQEGFMPSLFQILYRSCLTTSLAFSLLACTTQTPPQADTPSLEQRMFELERRMERLEARTWVEPPYRSKAEIQAHIKTLQSERAELLTRYLDQHPEIRDIDRKLEILNNQLKMQE